MSRLSSCVAVSVLVSALACGLTAAGQDRPAEKSAYLGLIERYASGDYDGAAWAASSADPDHAGANGVIAAVEREMLRLGRLGEGAGLGGELRSENNRLRGLRVRLLKLSLLLHTEAAIKALDANRAEQHIAVASGSISRLRGLEEDYRVHGPSSDPDEWHGETVASRPAPSPATRARLGQTEWEALTLLIRDWYLVVVSQLQLLGASIELDRYVREGLELFKNDPELLLARGTLSEGQAHGSIIDRSLASVLYRADFIQQNRVALAQSRNDYDSALKRQPTLHEARLRRGRVSAHLGDRRAARLAYEAVTAGNSQVELRHLAWVFLGQLAEQEDELEQARAAFERALDLMPKAQAPMLALSRLCNAAADVVCARRWLDRALATAGQRSTDPWSDYLRGQAWLRGERLASLRVNGLER